MDTAFTTPQRGRAAHARKQVNAAFAYIVLIILAMIFIAPFYWIVSTSLKAPFELSAFPIRWWPDVPQWQNYWQSVTLVDYLRYARNSFFLAIIQATLSTLTSALVGFGFARLKGRGKRIMLIVMLSTLMLPPILTAIPTYVLFARFGLIDTYWPWVMWGLASSPFLAFLFRQFFMGIPAELEEAAIIDGCGYLRIFWQIFLPLSMPVLVTSFILSFTGAWGDFVAPSLFLSQDNTTLAVAMSTGYVDPQGNVLPNVLSAGVLLYVLPMLVIFFFAQRAFVRGIATSGLKG